MVVGFVAVCLVFLIISVRTWLDFLQLVPMFALRDRMLLLGFTADSTLISVLWPSFGLFYLVSVAVYLVLRVFPRCYCYVTGNWPGFFFRSELRDPVAFWLVLLKVHIRLWWHFIESKWFFNGIERVIFFYALALRRFDGPQAAVRVDSNASLRFSSVVVLVLFCLVWFFYRHSPLFFFVRFPVFR